MKPNIFEYENYREYLKDMYQALKKSRRAFSFRYFAREAGLSSPSFLRYVMEGKRNLTAKSIPKFAKALKLNQQEAEFFENLVNFNQAETSEEKTTYFERMTRSRRFREIRGIEKDRFEYYSTWYHSAIRELVTFQHFKDDPSWIAQQLVPPITEREAEKALALLLRLDLIKRDNKGRLIQTDTSITTGPEVQSLAVMNFHKEMLQKGAQALETVAAKERDISALTIGLQASQLQELKDMVIDFRRKVSTVFADSEKPSECVYQLNLQLFPLTRSTGELS